MVFFQRKAKSLDICFLWIEREKALNINNLLRIKQIN